MFEWTDHSCQADHKPRTSFSKVFRITEYLYDLRTPRYLNAKAFIGEVWQYPIGTVLSAFAL